MNRGIIYAVGLCCIWPVVFYFGVNYLLSFINRHDLNNIQWNDIRWPWSKPE